MGDWEYAKLDLALCFVIDMTIFFQGIYVTRVSEGGPAEVAGLQIGDKIMQVTLQGENEAWLLPPEVPGRLTRLTSPLEEAGSLFCLSQLWCFQLLPGTSRDIN